MSQLDVARDRFRKALETLEKAGSTPLPAQESVDGAADRIAALEAERESLQAKIAMLEEEMAALSGLTEEVEGRLDGAIGEIRAALAR